MKNFSEYTDQELIEAEDNFKRILEQKMVLMIFDESLDLIYDKLEKIEIEKMRRESK